MDQTLNLKLIKLFTIAYHYYFIHKGMRKCYFLNISKRYQGERERALFAGSLLRWPQLLGLAQSKQKASSMSPT